MNAIRIEIVSNRKQLRDFVKFQLEHYRGNEYFVPPIIADEIETFSPDKNPAFDHAEARLFLAYEGDRVVGRIAAILSHAANEKYQSKNIRFGWIEMINSYEVASALLDSVAQWGRERGMETMTGPHGFCDLDPQGMLVEGFDKLATIASYYHYPYYKELVERYGCEKDVDFVEYLSTTPKLEDFPDKLIRANEWIQKRYKFHVVRYTKLKQYVARARELFRLLDETFANNYGTVPLTTKQADYYTKKYLGYINTDLIKFVDNEKGELIGFLLTMPSLSKAFQKANGKLFPTGWYHLLKALKTYDVLDFYFAGVRDDYRGKGVDVIMVTEIVQAAIKYGFRHAESNQELEHNNKVQALWKDFNPVMHKRRRIYKKSII